MGMRTLNVNYEDKKRVYMELFKKPVWTPGDIKRMEDINRQMNFIKSLVGGAKWLT